MFLSPDDVPPNRREAHRRALEIVDRYESAGRPFSLMLRTYMVTQQFGEPPEGFHARHLFENLLHDELSPLGLDVILVQPQGMGTERHFPVETGGQDSDFVIRSPALYMRTEGWLESVRYLIARAGLVVVLLQAGTPGLLQELDTIIAMGRADDTVLVLLSTEGFPPPPELPALEGFLRQTYGHQLQFDRPGLVEHFLLKDLVVSMTDHQVSRPLQTNWHTIAAGYEQQARSERGDRALADAAASFGRATRAWIRSNEPLRAVNAAIDQATILEQLNDAANANEVTRKMANALSLATGHETRRAQARLDASVARRMASEEDATGALNLVTHSLNRGSERDDPGSASELHSAEAWIRRGNGDVLGAMSAAQQAVALASRAGGAEELWRSLIVLGVLWGDLDEWTPSGMDAFARAVSVMPEVGAEDDLWFVLMTMGRVASQILDWPTAERAYTAAAESALVGKLPAQARTAREALLTVLAEKVASGGEL